MLLALTLIFSMIPVAAATTPVADSVYRNGNIYTVDEAFSTATALAIQGDRLIYVGDEAGVDAYIGPNTKVTDLNGKTVIPGLIEGHMHVNGLGESLLQIDAFWKPKDVILAAVAAEVAKAEPGQWIRGRGWLNTVWEDTSYPTREELDAVAPDNPVYLTRADGHMCWVNSKAFELAGITKDTPDPQGGEYLKTEDGELQGCVTDTAMYPISALLPSYTIEQQRQALLLAQNQIFSYGLTSAMNAGTGVTSLNEVYKYLYESGELKLRTYILMSLSSTEGEQADYLRNTPIQTGLYNNRMDVRAVKLFGDGSLGARSAAMLEEYSDRAGHIGNYRNTDEEMDALVKLAYDAGYQIGTHAIGDGANHQVLNSYEKAMAANPQEDPRLRIEHFQILTLDDIQRSIDIGVLPSMQTTHAVSDMLMAEDRIGSRIEGAYAWRTIIESGSIIINGSDAPVELVNPYHGLDAAVNRKSRLGEPPEGWHVDQCMTREEALRSFTIWAAYGEFNENLKGSLEVGKLADFAVIDRDYMTCPAQDIKDIQALLTVCGGEEVYKKDMSQPTIMWNGLPLTFNSKIIFDPGTIYVPLNDAVNGVGAEKTVSGSNVTVTLSGKSVTLAVRTEGGVDYVPVRALFEGLGRNVTWYGDSHCVSIGWMK